MEPRWLAVDTVSAKIGPERAQGLRQRVADEIKTTFASSYTEEISLAQALQVDVLQTYALQATGKKFLINPTLSSSRHRYWAGVWRRRISCDASNPLTAGRDITGP